MYRKKAALSDQLVSQQSSVLLVKTLLLAIRTYWLFISLMDSFTVVILFHGMENMCGSIKKVTASKDTDLAVNGFNQGVPLDYIV